MDIKIVLMNMIIIKNKEIPTKQKPFLGTKIYKKIF